MAYGWLESGTKEYIYMIKPLIPWFIKRKIIYLGSFSISHIFY